MKFVKKNINDGILLGHIWNVVALQQKMAHLCLQNDLSLSTTVSMDEMMRPVLAYSVHHQNDTRVVFSGKAYSDQEPGLVVTLMAIEGRVVSELHPPTIRVTPVTNTVIAYWKRQLRIDHDITDPDTKSIEANMKVRNEAAWVGFDQKNQEIIRVRDGEKNDSFELVERIQYVDLPQIGKVVAVFYRDEKLEKGATPKTVAQAIQQTESQGGEIVENPPRETDSTGAMASAWFGTPGAGAAVERVFGKKVVKAGDVVQEVKVITKFQYKEMSNADKTAYLKQIDTVLKKDVFSHEEMSALKEVLQSHVLDVDEELELRLKWLIATDFDFDLIETSNLSERDKSMAASRLFAQDASNHFLDKGFHAYPQLSERITKAYIKLLLSLNNLTMNQITYLVDVKQQRPKLLTQDQLQEIEIIAHKALGSTPRKTNSFSRVSSKTAKTSVKKEVKKGAKAPTVAKKTPVVKATSQKAK